MNAELSEMLAAGKNNTADVAINSPLMLSVRSLLFGPSSSFLPPMFGTLAGWLKAGRSTFRTRPEQNPYRRISILAAKSGNWQQFTATT
ncbi:MAG TPA: hypothetical protein VHD35_03195 [Chitinophagaceae bacterium]|nr:hypothetical protein [Chitinophagaceae bacterium]